MLFNSREFLIFFLVVVLAYYALASRYRWILLLAASYFFYMFWRPEYALLIFASTLIDYLAAHGMARTSGLRRKLCLAASLTSNLGLLFLFKYFDFFSRSIASTGEALGYHLSTPSLDLLLPVGISFYTFQTLSYSIDVYRGRMKPTRHFGIFALYVAFFPQLVAGPIERATRLLPQFYQKIQFDYARTISGLRLMLWGFFKKVFIADRLAVFVDQIYNAPHEYPGSMLIMGTVFFAFQIYCDFSGYTDIAIGCARVLGFDLMKNFQQPYLANSVADFWKRWHISLSTWFRDYVYFSLGGNRVSVPRWYLNMLVVFVVSGLWHGANWTFVVWGGLHAIYMILSHVTHPLRKKLADLSRLSAIPSLHEAARVLVTFSLVCFAWIFFRANSLADALYIATHLLDGVGPDTLVPYMPLLASFDFTLACLAISGLLVVQLFQQHRDIGRIFGHLPVGMRWSVYYATVCLMLFWGKFQEQAFIYFQF